MGMTRHSLRLYELSFPLNSNTKDNEKRQLLFSETCKKQLFIEFDNEKTNTFNIS